MRKNNIAFCGEENKTNHEVYQLLNWRFQVVYYKQPKEMGWEDICKSKPDLIVVSLIGSKPDYLALFDDISKKSPEIPVVTIGTAKESSAYADFYESGQFYRILRPVTGKRVIDFCRSVLSGMLAPTETKEEEAAPEIRPHILVVELFHWHWSPAWGWSCLIWVFI